MTKEGLTKGELNIHICFSGETEERKLNTRNRWKWCYNCRKRLPHMLTALVEKAPSYYDPVIFWKCGRCGKDHTRMTWE